VTIHPPRLAACAQTSAATVTPPSAACPEPREGSHYPPPPLIRPQDRPAIALNRDVMARYRPQMRRYYYDPSKYRTYLEQLGIT